MDADALAEHKRSIRRAAHAARHAQADKPGLSRRIMDRVESLPGYALAATVMVYIDVRDEVRTRDALPGVIASGRRVVVPYCVDAHLELFHLESFDELELGTFGILEPRTSLRAIQEKRVDVEQLDLILVPGVAFDRQGGRIGHGMGYYDRLLRKARPDTPLVGLAFECQLFEAIPTERHDIPMDWIITETATYQCHPAGQSRRNESLDHG